MKWQTARVSYAEFNGHPSVYYNIQLLHFLCVLHTCLRMWNVVAHTPYILESNPHSFHSLRGLKNEMRIRIACGLDSQSWAGFWKNDRAAVRAVRTIQYNNILFYLLFIIYYIIFIIYYSSDSPSSLITESLSVTQSLPSLSSPSSSHRMSSSDPSKALLRQHFLKDLTILLSGTAFHAADTHRATSEGAAD